MTVASKSDPHLRGSKCRTTESVAVISDAAKIAHLDDVIFSLKIDSNLTIGIAR